MPLDNDPSFWKWLAGSILTAGGTMFGYHKYIESKIAKKADKDYVNTEFSEVKQEIGRIREVQAKAFDQARENEQRAQDRHERLMERLPVR